MNKQVNWHRSLTLTISFGIFWYVVSLWTFDSSLDRIFETYHDDFIVRSAALTVYFLCSLATGNAYGNFVLGIKEAWLQRKNRK